MSLHKICEAYYSSDSDDSTDEAADFKPDQPDPSIEKKFFPCPFCLSVVFHNPSELISHLRTHKERECGTSFSEPTKKNCTGFQLSKHSDSKGSPSVRAKHRCLFCTKSFNFSHLLENHVRLHIGERPFGCDLCPNSFASKKNFTRHMVSQHPSEHIGNAKCSSKSQMSVLSKIFICDLCFRKFATRAKLKRHNHSVHKVRFKCTKCFKTFRHKSVLKYHIKIHTSDKPFGCTMCTKTFVRKEHLIRHSRNHDDDGKKTFQCSLCLKRFGGKHLLKRHVGRVHFKTN